MIKEKNNFFYKNKKGFTLIELLIVIFIIGLLATIVTISISGVKSKSRDAKRVSEITQLQVALDNYNRIEGKYPELLVPGESLIGSSTEIVFMSKIPENFSYYNLDCYVDGYEYSYDVVENKYKIAFCLEGVTDNYSPGGKCAMDNKIYDNICEEDAFFCGQQVADSESNIYDTALIGNQCWFVQNLNIGEMILGASSQLDNDIYEKYCYDNNSDNCEIYGGLYQWNEMMNYSTSTNQGLCPSGWHISSNEDWLELINYLSIDGNSGAGTSVAGKLKEGGTLHWALEGCGNSVCNSSGFTALPGGFRGTGNFSGINNFNFLWTFSQADTNSYIYYSLNYLSSPPSSSALNSENGFSVRCIKN